jgi:hypothetical protein
LLKKTQQLTARELAMRSKKEEKVEIVSDLQPKK